MDNFNEDNIVCLFIEGKPAQAHADINVLSHTAEAISQRLRDIGDEEGELKARQHYHYRARLYEKESVRIAGGCPAALVRARKYHDIYFLELFVTYDPPRRPFHYHADSADIIAFAPQQR